MSRIHRLIPAHIDTSVIGEEDPGASLEMFRAQALQSRAQSDSKARAVPGAESPDAHNPYLTINCSNNGKCFTIQVQWQAHAEREFTDLLGLVIAEHAVISDVAWAHHVQTGQDPVQLEMGATAGGQAAVQVKNAPQPGQAGAPAPRRKVLHEPFIAANDHVPYGTQRLYR
jgi:hypothetical protein